MLTPPAERGPGSMNSTVVVLENKAKLGFQNELPSDEGRELYHFLLHCFDVQIGKNTMASLRNIRF